MSGGPPRRTTPRAILLLALLSAGAATGADDETAVADAIALYGQQRFAEALQLFEPAARSGSAAAQYHLGLLYARGDGVSQDFARAARWFELAAEQDHAHSQFILGHMFARGEGVARDVIEAHVWFSTATANGWWKAREARERLVEAGMSPQQVAAAGKRYRERISRREVGPEAR